jgi:hypothetical protein
MMSERLEAGRLISIPGKVDAAATMPSRSPGVPRLVAKGFRTGFLDIVELKMANDPIVHKSKNRLLFANAFFGGSKVLQLCFICSLYYFGFSSKST